MKNKVINLMEIDNKKAYDTDDIIFELKNLDGVNIKKFLTEVRKVFKKRTTTPLWYGFSETLTDKYNLKNKDKISIIKGDYEEGTINGGKDYKRYNFQVIPMAEKYETFIYMYLNIVDNKVIIEDIFGANHVF